MTTDGGRANGWELLRADEQERAAFADLESTLRHVVGTAAPPNRFRQVHRLESGGRVWFLKEFRHTQWKNRWRSRLTAPRCVWDADRERLIGKALQARGIDVARPVAVGRSGGRTFYLCAALQGVSLAKRLARDDLDPAVAGDAARFAGEILRRGVQLPDLSADHIFAMDDGGFAVIDLHNGFLGDHTSRRTAVRILRRFAKSVRGCAVRRQVALAFACRMLRSAGLAAADRRRAVEQTPPMDTHGRYEVPGRSARYRHRNARRTERELELLRRVWPGVTGELVLDCPAGAGRLGPMLRDQLGVRRIGSDRAAAMLRESRGAGDPDPLLQGDAATLPFVDRATDGVVLFRFLHHLDHRSARAVLADACRVADRFLVVSFFHPVSIHGIRRRVAQWLTRRARTRFTITRTRLESWLREYGFEIVHVAADRALLRDFWVASFVRTDYSPPNDRDKKP